MGTRRGRDAGTGRENYEVTVFTRRRRGGFILAAAIAICFAMVVISLIVANQQRSLVGFARNTHAEAQQAEAALSGFAQMRGWLMGQQASSRLYSSSGALVQGNNQGSVDTPDGVKLTHRIGYRPPGNVTEPHSYAQPTPAPGVNGLTVPPCHTSVLYEATVKADEKAGTNKFVGLFSSNYPFALISEGGSVDAGQVHSVSNVSGATFTPLMAHVYGLTGVNIPGRANGRIYSTGGISVGSGGIPYPQYPTRFPIPQDFVAAANEFKTARVPGGATSTRLQDALVALNEAQHRDFTAADAVQTAQHNVGNGIPTPPLTSSLGGEPAVQSVITAASVGETTLESGQLTVRTAVLRIPANAKERLSVSMVRANQGIILEDGAVLHIEGALETPVVRMGRRTTLSLASTLSTGRIALTYTPGEEPISTCVLTRGVAVLGSGMTRESLLGPPIPMPPVPAGFPYPANQTVYFTTPTEPPTIVPETESSTSLRTAFTTQAAQDVANLTSKGLPDYLVSLPVGPADTVNVPGVFLDCGSTISANPGARAVGLLYARDNIMLTNAVLVGAAWARGAVGVRTELFFPYFTHVFGNFGDATPMNISATDQHPVGFGKLP